MKVERGARQHVRNLLNEALDTRLANKFVRVLAADDGTGFLVSILAVMKIFQIEKFLRPSTVPVGSL